MVMGLGQQPRPAVGHSRLPEVLVGHRNAVFLKFGCFKV